jgi:flagellar protein FlaG
MNISPIAGAAVAAPSTERRASTVAGGQPTGAAVAAPHETHAPVVQPAARAAEVAAQLDRYVKSSSRDLDFRVDQTSGRVVVSVLDKETGELIRQIPDEVALRIAQRLAGHAMAAGSLLVDESA